MAKRIFTDESLTTLVDQTKSYVDSAVSNKVDKVSGKGLSTNDLTNTLKTNYDAAYAHSNTTHVKTKSDIGLGNVDNTSDLNKPVSKATTAAIKVVSDEIAEHVDDGDIHFSADERTKLAGIASGANKYTHPNSGVTAGTYKSVTVNAAGHVTGGSNPTSISGYGITDAYTKTQVDSAISNATTNANKYTDDKIDAIMGEGAADTLNTIGEISAAIEQDRDVMDALNLAIGNKVDKVSGKELSTNDYTTAEKNKLAGIATGAEVNQNAFSSIVVGSTTVAADSKTDSVTFSGTNITIAGDATNDSISFTVPDGTTSAKGVVKLSNSTSSASTVLAATPKAVNDVKKLADAAQTAADSAADNSITGLSVSGKVITYTKGNGTTATITTQDTVYTHPSSHAASMITGLADVATSGNYNDLSNKPSIPTVYKEAQCTTFTSDEGTCTPAAVKKATTMFAIPKVTSTDNAITRFDGTSGAVQNSKIIIEDVTNSKDSSKKAQVISIPAEGGKKMVYGYCTDQVDGTSFIGGVFASTATSYPYSQGLAIGGTSGNLLWKGQKVIDASNISDYANKYTHPSHTAKSSGLYKITVDSSGHVSAATTVSKADITALGIPSSNTTYGGAGSSLGLVKSGGDVTISSGVITVNDDSHSHSNYLPLEGGILTDNLYVQTSSYPSFRATDSTVGGCAMISDYGSAAVFETRNSNNVTTNRRRLFLRNTTADVTDLDKALYINTTDNGTASANYYIYGEHNKPTPADIGAAESSHDHTIANITGLQTALDGKLSTTGTAAKATTATNAGTATYATNANKATTATNAGTATYAKTASTATYLNASSAISKYFRVYDANNKQVGVWYSSTAGTTANTGASYMMIGNSSASSVAGNARGYLRLYDATTAYTELRTSGSNGANRTVIVPNASGTMAYVNHLGRTNACTAANTSYGTYMARAIAAGTGALTAGSTTMTNGTIYFQYE